MSAKKIIPVMLMAFLISFVTPTFATNVTPVKKEVPKEVRAQQIENRLIEIRNMDKSNLSRADKKELRKEVKGLKKEARHAGIYLSVGAIIIIVLLLILLL
ncbi:MAG: hypothetical protein ACTHNG_03740 [Ginsengibacter sp.]|jgi:hypothetical protein|nr:hypothetical protein [Hanamia sp.]